MTISFPCFYYHCLVDSVRLPFCTSISFDTSHALQINALCFGHHGYNWKPFPQMQQSSLFLHLVTFFHKLNYFPVHNSLPVATQEMSHFSRSNQKDTLRHLCNDFSESLPWWLVTLLVEHCYYGVFWHRFTIKYK